MRLTQAAVHHGENDQSRKTVNANKQISDRYYQSVDSKESDYLNQVNERIVDKACDTVGDLAICDDVEKNYAFTSIEQESQGDIGVSDCNTSSDEGIIDENQAKDVQDEQELPGQHTHHNEIINSVCEATSGNDDPSKDPDHTIDAEMNTIIDEPDHTLDSMEINIVGEANDTYGHPSQESDVTVNVENSNIDEPEVTDVNSDCRYDSDLNTVSEANNVHHHSGQEIGVQINMENSNVDEPNIHDSSKTNDGNAEQTNSIVDDDVEQNDVSQNIIQDLQNKTVSKDVGMEEADETTNVSGETTFIDPGKEFSIQGGVEMNNATSLEGSSRILGEQNIEQV
jgi:hypothetical protein